MQDIAPLPLRTYPNISVAVFQKSFHVSTKGHNEVIDLTPEVQRIVTESGVREGIVNVAGRGSTLAVTMIEFEPGAVADLQRALEKIAPVKGVALMLDISPSMC